MEAENSELLQSLLQPKLTAEDSLPKFTREIIDLCESGDLKNYFSLCKDESFTIEIRKCIDELTMSSMLIDDWLNDCVISAVPFNKNWLNKAAK